MTITSVLVSWAILSVAIWVAARLIPGFNVDGPAGAIVAAALFGVLHALLGWFIFGVLGIATLGLAFLLAFITRFVVDAIVLKLADVLSSRMTVSGFLTALWAALVIALTTTAVEWVLRRGVV